MPIKFERKEKIGRDEIAEGIEQYGGKNAIMEYWAYSVAVAECLPVSISRSSDPLSSRIGSRLPYSKVPSQSDGQNIFNMVIRPSLGNLTQDEQKERASILAGLDFYKRLSRVASHQVNKKSTKNEVDSSGKEKSTGLIDTIFDAFCKDCPYVYQYFPWSNGIYEPFLKAMFAGGIAGLLVMAMVEIDQVPTNTDSDEQGLRELLSAIEKVRALSEASDLDKRARIYQGSYEFDEFCDAFDTYEAREFFNSDEFDNLIKSPNPDDRVIDFTYLDDSSDEPAPIKESPSRYFSWLQEVVEAAIKDRQLDLVACGDPPGRATNSKPIWRLYSRTLTSLQFKFSYDSSGQKNDEAIHERLFKGENVAVHIVRLVTSVQMTNLKASIERHKAMSMNKLRQGGHQYRHDIYGSINTYESYCIVE